MGRRGEAFVHEQIEKRENLNSRTYHFFRFVANAGLLITTFSAWQDDPTSSFQGTTSADGVSRSFIRAYSVAFQCPEMSVFVVVRRRVVRRARRVPGIVQNVLAQPFRFLCFSSQRSPSYQILGSRFVVAFSSGKASRPVLLIIRYFLTSFKESCMGIFRAHAFGSTPKRLNVETHPCRTQCHRSAKCSENCNQFSRLNAAHGRLF